jgi:hypothetical protein
MIQASTFQRVLPNRRITPCVCSATGRQSCRKATRHYHAAVPELQLSLRTVQASLATRQTAMDARKLPGGAVRSR